MSNTRVQIFNMIISETSAKPTHHTILAFYLKEKAHNGKRNQTRYQANYFFVNMLIGYRRNRDNLHHASLTSETGMFVTKVNVQDERSVLMSTLYSRKLACYCRTLVSVFAFTNTHTQIENFISGVAQVSTARWRWQIFRSFPSKILLL